eukprot:CAMPEP_0175100466 /NCGR_PEP_ID=MMETSP0086_2-20121207/7125_1 /TAXON_ID=136419 /ORGANISM="Unknown Unknown, Strain D1" /LENGTH=106 /DNA_ID=CAMNT_0016374625 /DNA_START=268 /DNA_END=589 /DNA_ORIENTATION=-
MSLSTSAGVTVHITTGLALPQGAYEVSDKLLDKDSSQLSVGEKRSLSSVSLVSRPGEGGAAEEKAAAEEADEEDDEEDDEIEAPFPPFFLCSPVLGLALEAIRSIE